MAESLAIALHSDLHLELQGWPKGMMAGHTAGTRQTPDVVVLAGDIASFTEVGRYLQEMSGRFPAAHILYVPGNHEGYGIADMQAAEAALTLRFASNPHIHVLQQDTVVIGDVRFLGCTLWSSFLGNGRARQAAARLQAQRSIEDFRVIGYQKRVFTADDCQALSEQHQAWLARELATAFSGKTVIVTHFAPSMSLANRRFDPSDITPYFNLDLDHLIHQYAPDLWCYGHTHDNFDLEIGATRVVSNQRGYGNECVRSYNANLLVYV
jgi:predicted phosphodiesterase